jgi:hypothetical protein
MISPGIYNMSNGFTVIWLSGQFRWLMLQSLLTGTIIRHDKLASPVYWKSHIFFLLLPFVSTFWQPSLLGYIKLAAC